MAHDNSGSSNEGCAAANVNDKHAPSMATHASAKGLAANPSSAADQLEALREEIARLKKSEERRDHLESQKRIARDYGEPWFVNTGLNAWGDYSPAFSSTVAVAIPQRAHNGEVLPELLYRHWINTVANLLDTLFGGCTVFSSAAGTWLDTDVDPPVQHAEMPFVVESLASVDKLSDENIKKLVEMCEYMMVSLDQGSVLLIVGGARVYVSYPYRRSPEKKDVYALDKATTNFVREADGGGYKVYGDGYAKRVQDRDEYYAGWAKKRLEMWVRAQQSGMPLRQSMECGSHYLELARRIDFRGKQPSDAKEIETLVGKIENLLGNLGATDSEHVNNHWLRQGGNTGASHELWKTYEKTFHSSQPVEKLSSGKE